MSLKNNPYRGTFEDSKSLLTSNNKVMKQDHDLDGRQHSRPASTQNARIHKQHPDDSSDLALLAQQFLELEKHVHIVNAGLRNYLHALSVEEMIAKVNSLNLSSKTLNILYAGIVLDKEDDVAMALTEIRQRTADTTADAVDHMNYTSL